MARGSTKVERQKGGGEGPEFKASMSTRYGLDKVFTVLVTVAVWWV